MNESERSRIRPEKRRGWLAPANLFLLVGAILIIAAVGVYLIRGHGDGHQVRIGVPPPVTAAATPAATPTSERIASTSKDLWPPLVQSDTGSTPAATATSAPAKKPRPNATQLEIPSVGINTKIEQVGYQTIMVDGEPVIQWNVADYAASHDENSGNPGDGKNIVLTGHDDWKGQVFENLHNVKKGAIVTLVSPAGTFHYAVSQILYRQEVGMPLSFRIQTGHYLDPTAPERVTLVTCWPYGVDTHRLIVIATPVK
ncbi:MAG TPA: sortase [Thermomicrobiaceae bacterium]|nr:sortase [Thermomicrobiaceae bacterium]